ncbi:Uncharacterised protein [Mycobacteroides abscessus subsp. abscessus]|nr:Uncharacterised protein [Mycobacteroides abscessus subsp. abscessus]
MTEATGCLADAKRLNDELEKIYSEAMDYTIVDTIRGRIEEKILRVETPHPIYAD